MARSITKKQSILKQVTSLVAEYGREDELLYIEFLLEQTNPDTGNKFTLADIARLKYVTPQAMYDRFPELKKKKGASK